MVSRSSSVSKCACISSCAFTSLGSVTTWVGNPPAGNNTILADGNCGFALYCAKICWAQISFCTSINNEPVILTLQANVRSKRSKTSLSPLQSVFCDDKRKCVYFPLRIILFPFWSPGVICRVAVKHEKVEWPPGRGLPGYWDKASCALGQIQNRVSPSLIVCMDGFILRGLYTVTLDTISFHSQVPGSAQIFCSPHQQITHPHHPWFSLVQTWMLDHPRPPPCLAILAGESESSQRPLKYLRQQ